MLESSLEHYCSLTISHLASYLLSFSSFSLLSYQELEDPLILIHEKKISSLNAVVKVLELALKVTVVL